MTSTEQTTTCKLLELSAELRNLIYSFALCEEKAIDIPRTGRQQPSLTRTCRQIRKEATPIYYLDNSFEIPTPGCERHTGEHFENQAHAHVNTAKIAFSLNFDDSPYSWSEFMKWLKSYHDGETGGWDLNLVWHQESPLDWTPADPYYVAAKGFEVVKKLKGSVQWSVIVDVLQSYKEGTSDIVGWVE